MAAAAVPFISGRYVAVAGAGAIGSFVLPLVARIPGVERVAPIDHDACTESNLSSQNICESDVGKAKVVAHAWRLQRINSALIVDAMREPIEAVPMGRLRGAVIASCLDSRRARQRTNELAWRLGAPWVDAAVDAETASVRVNCYVPGPDQACMECAWDDRDYELLEQAYPCQGVPEAYPTNAPSELAALAASLQAAEIRKLLTGDREAALVGRQVLMDTQSHAHHVSHFTRNEHCRFDHETWPIRRIDCYPADLSLDDAFALVPAVPDAGRPQVSVPGQTFVRRLTCPGCGWQTRALLHLANRLPPWRRPCRACGERLVAAGFDRFEELDASRLSAACRRRTLGSIGVRRGDVLCLSAGSGESHYFEIGG